MLVDGLLRGAADFLFSLEPVIEFAARFIAVLDVELVRPAADTFFEGEPFLKALFCRCGCCHWDHLWR